MSYRRRHESGGLEVEGSTAGASGGGDLEKVTYEWACGCRVHMQDDFDGFSMSFFACSPNVRKTRNGIKSAH